ncbi:2'-5' RNA ligase family protein [Emticicia sp. SJ17W-69]|uniref:2'-5' RNA ligase family protein n=1 Tax=Emticicia sp. SJ17W-69 TaxID=3421657 RepID=UPI003EC1342B
MRITRQQLTLFVEEPFSNTIETIRKKYNPEQFQLIKAHVTLCREDEITDIENVLKNLRNLDFGAITINFGEIIRFSEGKGLLISADKNNDPFHQLRESILSNIIEKPRKHNPHITLMHPRNSSCTDEIFNKINQISFPQRIKFHKISLIEQENGGKWRILEEFI